ncbi:MAG: M15 family metallopeptidase [Kibdelosporangium sp.]
MKYTGVGLMVALAAFLGGCSAAGASSEDGYIPEGESISVRDTGHPALRNLDAKLVQALHQAADEARADGVELKVTSGWRSKQYQERLLAEAVDRYGSLAKARKFVNTPDQSTHVSGRAVDIGPTRAADWMVQHGSDFGLCQAYGNEIWHFELLTEPGGDCPPQQPDAAGQADQVSW